MHTLNILLLYFIHQLYLKNAEKCLKNIEGYQGNRPPSIHGSTRVAPGADVKPLM